MDRGIPGDLLPARGEHAEEDLFSARYMPLDSDGFPFSAQTATGNSGLSKPEGPDLRSWREEEGVLRNAEILSGTSGNSAEVIERKGRNKALPLSSFRQSDPRNWKLFAYRSKANGNDAPRICPVYCSC